MDLLIVWRCLFSVPCLFMMFLDDFVGASLCSFVKGASPCISFNLVDSKELVLVFYLVLQMQKKLRFNKVLSRLGQYQTRYCDLEAELYSMRHNIVLSPDLGHNMFYLVLSPDQGMEVELHSIVSSLRAPKKLKFYWTSGLLLQMETGIAHSHWSVASYYIQLILGSQSVRTETLKFDVV